MQKHIYIPEKHLYIYICILHTYIYTPDQIRVQLYACTYMSIYVFVYAATIFVLSSVSQETRHLCKRECAVRMQSQLKYKRHPDSDGRTCRDTA